MWQWLGKNKVETKVKNKNVTHLEAETKVKNKEVNHLETETAIKKALIDLWESKNKGVANSNAETAFKQALAEVWNPQYTYPNDVDEGEWEAIDSSHEEIRNLDENTLTRYRNLSRQLYMWNPHMRGIVRNYIKFIVGKGFAVQPFLQQAPDFSSLDNEALESVSLASTPQARKPGRVRDPEKTKIPSQETEEEKLFALCNYYWLVFKKRNKWTRRLKEIVRRFFRDGEVFLRFFKANNTLLVRFIDPERIVDRFGKHSWGIETEKDDVETPVTYYISGITEDNVLANTKTEAVPADEIIHIKATDSDVKRGTPELLSILKRLRQYDTWLQDRITLNKIRASIALIRKWRSAPSSVKSFVEGNATRVDTKTKAEGVVEERRQRIMPGTIIDTNKGVDYEFLSPNVQATDVRYDGRAIALSMAAGTGQAEYMVTADASNSNYSSTMVAESPAVREFEDWQEFFGGYITEIWDKLKIYLIALSKLPPVAKNVEVEVQPSQLIARNKLEDTQANEILLLNKVISPQIWGNREGVSSEKVLQDWRLYTNIEEEEINEDKESLKEKKKQTQEKVQGSKERIMLKSQGQSTIRPSTYRRA